MTPHGRGPTDDEIDNMEGVMFALLLGLAAAGAVTMAYAYWMGWVTW